MARLKELWRSNKLLFLAFLVAATLTTIFLVRTIVFTVYWADPARRDQTIEPWMTIRYVSYSWELPRAEMIKALGFEPESGRLLTFGDIATANGISMAELTARIEAAAIAFRADNP